MNPNDPPQRPPGDQPAGPAEADVAQLLAQVSMLRARGQLDQATAKCREALERDPDSWEAHELMGDLYRQDRKGEEAIQEYRIALARKPDRAVIEEKIARASLIAAERRRLIEDAQALLAGKADRSDVRKPGMAALFSLVIPGLGQIYNHDYLKGLLILPIWVVLIISLNLVVLPGIARGVGETDLGNLLGAFFGGFCEYLGMVVGLNNMLMVALAFYLTSLMLFRRGHVVE